ncbi:hypothetical protein V2J09_013442 [Rumex salicifolius]
MGGERQGPKGGGYVGGFLQLFDWNAKSRKKLFSSKSDLPEHLKQGKSGEGSFPATWTRMDDEIGTLSIKGSSGYSCASSVTDEEEYVHRAPGVVGRLMGLDSLPTSNAIDPYSSPFFDTQSLNEFQFRRKELHFNQEHQISNSRKFFNEAESLPRNKMELKHHQKLFSRPIEKFQKEILPPKSAKSIPSTQHKLLSPIKKPGFIPSNDVAHIIEAAARIIDPGPQTSVRTRISSSRSSSAPLKVRDLKEKLVASQRLEGFAEASQKKQLELNAAKRLKGQTSNRSCNGSVGTSSKAESSASTKNKGKSINLAIQAKVNVQRREGSLNSSRSVIVDGTKEDDTSGLSQSSKSESISQKNAVHKKPSTRTAASKVLRQNNQKQNCNSGKENVPSKSSANNVHGKKVVSEDFSHVHQRSLYRDSGSSKVGSRKSTLDKDVSLSGPRNVPRKKRSIDGNLQDLRNASVDSMLMGKNDQSNSHFYSAEESRKKGADVVSFTFSTPMARSGSFELPKQLAEERNSIFADNRSKKFMLYQENTSSPSLGYDVVGDSLSVLLEQKLKELTNGTEPYSSDSIISEASSWSKTGKQQNEIDSQELQLENMYSQMLSYFSSTEPFKRHDQEGEMDECSSTKVETRMLYDHTNPVPFVDSSDLTESCNSSSEECKTQTSYDYGQETVTEMETSAKDWELDYIKDILSTVELMFKDCASGRTRDIINPHLFDQLERKRGSSSSYDDAPLASKKAFFECVRECLDSRCQRYIGGGFSALEKGLTLVRRKEKLAEEVYKEIQEWRRLGDCMVDELVDKDMSVEYGKWLDFDADGFGIGVDVEAQIFDGLVSEVIDDILAVSRCK